MYFFPRLSNPLTLTRRKLKPDCCGCENAPPPARVPPHECAKTHATHSRFMQAITHSSRLMEEVRGNVIFPLSLLYLIVYFHLSSLLSFLFSLSLPPFSWTYFGSSAQATEIFSIRHNFSCSKYKFLFNEKREAVSPLVHHSFKLT